MAGSLIQGTGTVEFEDGLRVEVLPSLEAADALVVSAPILDSISNPLGMQVGPWLDVVVIRIPFQTKMQFCGVPHMSGTI